MDKDKEFLNKYWQEYENLIIKGRDDSKIILPKNKFFSEIKLNMRLCCITVLP